MIAECPCLLGFLAMNLQFSFVYSLRLNCRSAAGELNCRPASGELNCHPASGNRRTQLPPCGMRIEFEVPGKVTEPQMISSHKTQMNKKVSNQAGHRIGKIRQAGLFHIGWEFAP